MVRSRLRSVFYVIGLLLIVFGWSVRLWFREYRHVAASVAVLFLGLACLLTLQGHQNRAVLLLGIAYLLIIGILGAQRRKWKS